MSARTSGRVGCVAVLALVACGAQRPADVDAGEVVQTAALAVVHSRACAGELDRIADEDPAGVARALEVAPLALAPYGGPAAAPIRAEIAERLERARAEATAAAAIARAPEELGAGMAAARRAARSLEASGALCRAADRIARDRLARSR